MSEEISEDEQSQGSARDGRKSRNSISKYHDDFYSENYDSEPEEGSSYASVPHVIDASNFGTSSSPMLSILSYQTSSNWSSTRSNSASKFVADRINSANLKAKKERLNSKKELQREVQDLREQNRLLNRTVKRQDLELSRLGGTRGELPTILHAHNEEVRVLKEKLKKISEVKRDLNLRLDRKDAELFRMRESNKNLTSLTQTKKLDQREQLQVELGNVQDQLVLRDQENSDMRHKIAIIEKSHRQQMNHLRGKYHGLVKKMDLAKQEIEKLKDDIKEKDKLIHRSHIYAHRYNRRSNHSRMSGAISMFSINTRSDDDISEIDGTDKKALGHISPAVDREKDERHSMTKSETSESQENLENQADNDDQNETQGEEGGPSRKMMDRKDTFVREQNMDDDDDDDSKPTNDVEAHESPEKDTAKVDEESGNGGPDYDKSTLNSEEHDLKSDTNQQISRRDNSFISSREFFQSNGIVIQEKSYPKSEGANQNEPNSNQSSEDSPQKTGIHEMSDDDKMALWMPKGMSSRSSSIGSNPNPSSKGTPTHDSPSYRSRRATLDEKPLDSSKKVGLLAQLNDIDQSGSLKPANVYGDSFKAGGYSPSFGPAMKQQASVTFSTDYGDELTKGKGGFKAHGDLDQSLNSSIGSVNSVVSRKTNLMEELFGPGAK
ncbi:lebercilin-like isoform X2 [Tigriopus californicus]|uniref:lebercilin-like isoform X2 n=1 Tax=Tigriopus californicus TaxID=6832 RepID=UPI0027DA546A|nr:lebercilin-like isoform X2 [Tigriopus californicus]